MPNAVCPHCSRTLKYRPGQAGTQISCPACEGQLMLPDEGQPPPPLPRPAQTDGGLAFGDSPATRRGEPEPWYYRFVDTYARAALWLGVITTVLGGAITFLGYFGGALLAVDRMSPAALFGVVVAGVFTLLAMLLVLLAFVFQIALVLMAVDMGRNLRKIRQNTQK